MRKIDTLRKILRRLERVVVAYSGGLDSAFLLKVAIDTLGRDNVIAVTARSETYPASEYREAKAVAKGFGARHMTIRTNELSTRHFKENPVDRCYYCKRELFKKLDAIRRKFAMSYLLDGTNDDDMKDVRHGRRAARERGVRSPLLEAGIRKTDIRTHSRRLGLPTWNKPPFACLASRIPFGTAITADGLARVGRAEEAVRNLGVAQVRVRAHGPVARIEIPAVDFPALLTRRGAVTRRLKRLGFPYVALDLDGYRTGSMHEAA